ncbi:unnamed protein product [Polarella glacialis]|uniref:Uncharacterized protein n=1 Tax=Polarella glacialis TaxID=89957 RepID=A0A813JYJ6_POLGL|nr:unnamed protein product [Polarella glacialis]
MGDMAMHDYRGAGAKMGQVMSDLNSWTQGHLCGAPICYVVSGITQYLGSLEDDEKKCGSDFTGAWRSFENAYSDISNETSKHWFAFSQNATEVTQGVHEIGNGFQLISESVKNCHALSDRPRACRREA